MADDLIEELLELAETPWIASQARAACRSAAVEIMKLRAADRVTDSDPHGDVVNPVIPHDRATIARALGEFVTHAPVASLDGPNGDYWLREADAVLAVLVPAPGAAVTLHAYTDADLDTIRAEAVEAFAATWSDDPADADEYEVRQHALKFAADLRKAAGS